MRRLRPPGLPAILGVSALLLVLLGLPVWAEDTAALKGIALDASLKPLPGVTIVLSNKALALAERGTVTNQSGEFHFSHLPPGSNYSVKASLAGYATLEFSDIVLPAGREITLNVQLRPGSQLQEKVRVAGQPDIVDTESAVTSTTFSSAFIAELPVFGRDYQEVLTLAPGVTDVNKTGNPNIHGARDTDVITLVDGVSATDPFTGFFGQQLNIESIQEVEVITSGATAGYSRAQGGFANIVTKSGGNEFQGAFKLFVRSSRLDGDGAGSDPIQGYGDPAGAQSMSDLSFTDIKPYLSLSGAIIKNRLWYYVAAEYLQEETPINAVTQAFIVRTTGSRGFGKSTWQMTPDQKLALSITYDRTNTFDQGLDSLTPVESGYTFSRGGPTYTLKHSFVARPDLSFESSASWFDNSFEVTPTTNPDTNGNGVFYIDYDGDGILKPNERDPGEDFDDDGAYDINESRGGDPDGDGRRTSQWGCEGLDHEDLNCDGQVTQEEDTNLNGRVDPAEDQGLLFPCNIGPTGFCDVYRAAPGTAGNGQFDTEDRNANGMLDVVGNSGNTPYPLWTDRNRDSIPEAGEFRAPIASDQDYSLDSLGNVTGPYYYSHLDDRTRLTLKEDISIFLGDLRGTHDLRIGAIYEGEGYDGDSTLRELTRHQPPRIRVSASGQRALVPGDLLTYTAFPSTTNLVSSGDNFGLYFQDTYKPLPNLTLGLGLRFDLERLQSQGFSPFDPSAERDIFDRLMGASGFDSNLFDATLQLGLCKDPLVICTGGGLPTDLRLAQMASTLRILASGQLTRHHSNETLRSLSNGGLTVQELQASGSAPLLPETFQVENRNLAPRLSLSWDPWGDGKSKVFASWGRFYDKLFLESISLEQEPQYLSRYYDFDSDGVNSRNGFPDHQVGPLITSSPPSLYQVDRNLATPYSVEFTAGFQRELAPELSLGFTYIHRNYEDQLQDIDVNHATRANPLTGRPQDFIGALECGNGGNDVPIPVSQCRPLPDGLPDLYIEDFYINRIFRLGNYNTQSYRGFEIELVRRLRRKWQLQGSYTYSKAYGDAESYAASLGDDPSLVEYEQGFLSYDQRHVLKLNAMAYLPHDWRIGGTAQWASGLPFSQVYSGPALDDAGYAQNRVIYGYFDENYLGAGLVREDRNIHRNHATYLFNARVQKNFVMGKAAASGFFEVYNLLNSDDLRIEQLQWSPGAPGTDTLPFQRMVGQRDFGRRFQIGIQINF